MAFMQTRFTQDFILELVCPHPPSGKRNSDVLKLGLELAQEICWSPHTLCRLSPFVVDVSVSTDEKIVDIPELTRAFDVNLYADHATSDFTQYGIVEKLGLFLNYTTTLVNQCVMRTTLHGLETLSDPGVGVAVYGQWKVEPAKPVNNSDVSNFTKTSVSDIAGPGSVEVDEEGAGLVSKTEHNSLVPTQTDSSAVIIVQETEQVLCNILFTWYIKYNLIKSRRIIHERFRELWLKEMDQRLCSRR